MGSDSRVGDGKGAGKKAQQGEEQGRQPDGASTAAEQESVGAGGGKAGARWGEKAGTKCAGKRVRGEQQTLRGGEAGRRAETAQRRWGKRMTLEGRKRSCQYGQAELLSTGRRKSEWSRGWWA